MMMFSHVIYSFSRGHKINASIKIDADRNRKYKIKTTETEKYTLPQPPCKKNIEMGRKCRVKRGICCGCFSVAVSCGKQRSEAKSHRVHSFQLKKQTMFPPKRFDNFFPSEGCSEGLDTFIFFVKLQSMRKRQSDHLQFIDCLQCMERGGTTICSL